MKTLHYPTSLPNSKPTTYPLPIHPNHLPNTSKHTQTPQSPSGFPQQPPEYLHHLPSALATSQTPLPPPEYLNCHLCGIIITPHTTLAPPLPPEHPNHHPNTLTLICTPSPPPQQYSLQPKCPKCHLTTT
ncbi:hypothetical protein HYDPIDRAFT_33486 [Hydnomerulius pinastri MD-312]|uniref:Uncharacterized protein n=1 Tax=Hydnomerulius pinastri MD-312 TaxID=994086 RepID=A0A0C9W8T6_9AGAM|nr:hypothetical protein HYDPIDRAFT_33486 [Hydnomerulius pinastri MD-312]